MLPPKGIREGLVDSSRIFVPATAIAIFFFISNLSYTDAGIAFAVMSVHAILFTWLNGTADYYAQARIYPIASILSFIMDSDHGPWFPQHLLRLCSVVNLISAYVFIPRLQKTIAGSAPAADEQLKQLQSTPSIPWRRNLFTNPLAR